jgi:hypothetical protein
MDERDDYADRELPPPKRAKCWLLAVAAGAVTILAVLLVAIIVSREFPPETSGADSRNDFAELMEAMQIRATVAIAAAVVAGIGVGAVVLRRTK